VSTALWLFCTAAGVSALPAAAAGNALGGTPGAVAAAAAAAAAAASATVPEPPDEPSPMLAGSADDDLQAKVQTGQQALHRMCAGCTGSAVLKFRMEGITPYISMMLNIMTHDQQSLEARNAVAITIMAGCLKCGLYSLQSSHHAAMP
jgi:hypothetical protein